MKNCEKSGKGKEKPTELFDFIPKEARVLGAATLGAAPPQQPPRPPGPPGRGRGGGGGGGRGRLGADPTNHFLKKNDYHGCPKKGCTGPPGHIS